MTPELALLPTDLLLLAAFTLVGIWARSQWRDPLLRARWITLLRQPVGGLPLIVLSLYALIALADSVRFEHEGARLSALDHLLAPLRLGGETTFSAPFATHGHVRETRILEDGRRLRDFPRLQHGGAHLERPEAGRGPDLGRRVVVGALGGFSAFLFLTLGVNLLRKRPLPRAFAQWRDPPWHWHWVTVGSLSVAIGVLATLAAGYHVLGTDKIGNDVLFLTLKSVRTGLVLGLITSIVTLPPALMLGLLAGYRGGWVDDVIQYLYTTVASVPGVLLVAAAALAMDLLIESGGAGVADPALRADLRLLALCGVLGLTGWTSLCRLVRTEVLKLRAMSFVDAGRALGSSGWTVLRLHLLPNVMSLVIITTVLDFSGLVLAEAVLTYIDIGVDPATESWGNLINSARLELARDPIVWWNLLAAFLGMSGLVLSANLFADAVRDALDPGLMIRLEHDTAA